MSEGCHAAVGPPPQLVPPDYLRQIMLPQMVPWTKYVCHGWPALPQVVPGSKPEKQWLQILIDEVTIKGYLEITPCTVVATANLVSLPRPLFLLHIHE